MAQPEIKIMAEGTQGSGPEIASGQSRRTTHFSEKYDPSRTDYMMQREGNDVVIRDPLIRNPQTQENEIVGRLPGIQQGTAPVVSPEAAVLRSITSQAPDVIREIRNQLIVPPEGPEGGTEKEGWPPRGLERLFEPNPEFEYSPERGRWLVEEVAYMETKLPYSKRWDAENGPKLVVLSQELIKFVWVMERDRNKEAPFSTEADHKVERRSGVTLWQTTINAYKELVERGVSQVDQEQGVSPVDFTEIDARGHDLTTLTAKFEDLSVSPAERVQVEKDLLEYFKEAKRKGLLIGIDEIFNTLYLDYEGNKKPVDYIKAVLDQKTVVDPARNPQPEAYITAMDKLRRRATDPGVNPRLLGIARAYIEWNRAKFRDILDGIDPGDYREGEWRVPDERDKGEVSETYWEPSPNYPGYYIVHARTPTQFLTAAETFLRMLKSHALGYAPGELTQFAQNFKNFLNAEATKLASEQRGFPESPNKMTSEFVDELRQKFDGDFYSWGAAYYGDHYNKDGYKQYFSAMALDEGPQRYVATIQSNDGGTGFHAKNQDNINGLFEFSLNAQGSRGQFKDSIVQNYIYGVVTEIQIEQGVGAIIKDYDHRDPTGGSSPQAFEVRLQRAKRLEQLEEHLRRNQYNLASLTEEDQKDYLRAQAQTRKNIKRITLHQSKEAFASSYEGFYNGDTHRNNYREYVEKRGLDPKVTNPKDPKYLPKKLRDSVRLGRIQVEMDKLRQEVRTGQVTLRSGETLIGQLVTLKRIDRKDRNFYEDAYDRSKASYETALQLQGITQETTVRGGGVYFVYRNKYERAYMEARERFLEEEGERLTKARLRLEELKIKWLEEEETKLTLEGRKKRWEQDAHTGWVLHEIRMGKRLETFPQYEKNLYLALSPEDRKTFIDNMSTQLTTKAVMAVANAIKMKYADDAPIWQREDLKKFIYDEDETGHFKYPNFRAVYRTEMVKRAVERATEEVFTNGYDAKFSDQEYKVLNFDPDRKKKALTLDKIPIKNAQIILKRPHIFGYTELGQPVVYFGQNGQPVDLEEADFDENKQVIIYDMPADIKRNGQVMTQRKKVNLNNLLNQGGYVAKEWMTPDGERRTTMMEEVSLDFATAYASYLALHTANTYFAYQSNSTDSLIPDWVQKQAELIRDGVLRQEDADAFAGLLLTLDPTLCRLRKFEGAQMALEGIVFDAAVDESYMTWVGVRNALNKKFSPRDGNSEFMQMGYYIEDRGGDARFTLMIHNLVSKMPKRWARRLAAGLGDLPIYGTTTADNVGADGLTELVSFMDDAIHRISDQRIVSQFGLMKSINLFDNGAKLWFTLIGGTDQQSGQPVEGLLLKPLANNDQLVRAWKTGSIFTDPAALNQFLYQLKETFARVEKSLKDIRTMYSEARNAQGALLLDKTDVFLPDGRYNPDINIDRNTGTSRQIAKMFWNAYVDWLISREPGGGVDFYGESAAFYDLLKTTLKIYDGKEVIDDPDGRTWGDWLFDKMVL